MATVKFYIRSKKNPANIYLRLTIDRENYFRRKSNYLADPNRWNSKKGIATGGDVEFKNLNLSLEKLATAIKERYNQAITEGIEVTNEWLQDEIDFFQGKRKKTDMDRLTIYFQTYIDKLPNKVFPGGKTGVTRNTIFKYNSLKKKIEEYEKYKKKQFYVKDVGLQFANDLITYFLEVDRLGRNTAGRYLKYLKTVCIDAKNNGYTAHSQLNEIRGLSEAALKIYLNFEELEKIEKKELEREALVNAKDWLIIGCYIGQRVSDLLVLTQKNIKVRNGIELIELTQKKTGKRVAIPLHPKVKEVIERNGGDFPRNISDQKFNKHIKDVCKLAGIDQLTKGGKMTYDEGNDMWRKELGNYPKWELVTTHICRRSFASNFYGDIPTALLISITGHATEAQFLGYIGKNQNDFASQLADYWSKESAKAKKEPQMTILSKAN
jgi:integrase